MELAALIISVIALLIALFCLIWILSKHFSKHVVQMVPVDPFKEMMKGDLGAAVGNPMSDAFRELGDPIDKDEFERLEEMRKRKGKVI